MRIRELPEASGVAASRRTPGIFWVHNDSDRPAVIALDERGTVKGRVRVTGADVEDWEDIAVGACPQGSCLYIADIGDNDGKRKHITIYRTPEPAPTDAGSAPVEAFHASYPEGPHDAESLLATRDSQMFIVTKGDPGDVALYRFPSSPRAGEIARLHRVAAAPAVNSGAGRPTAADISPDGRLVAVRTTAWVAFFPTADFLGGRWQEAARADLGFVREARGEGLTFADTNTLVLVGEGGGAGTFARVSCNLPSE